MNSSGRGNHPPAEPSAEAADELREKIEQTREQLGGTVEQLVAKTDLPAQARAKAAQVRRKAAETGGRAKAGLQNRAAPAWNAAPAPVRRTASQGASAVRQYRAELTTAAVVFMLAYLALRRWERD